MRPGLRWGCRAVVLAWSAALLARPWPPPLREPAPAATTRIQPVREPRQPRPEAPAAQPEGPRPAPEPPAAQPEAPRSAPEPPAEEPVSTRVSAADFRQGEGLLDGGGAFPALSFGYDAFPSFLSYARAMVGLGARFVVVRNREIVGTLDLESRSVDTAPLGRAFSPRARDYTSEPGLAPLARRARERFGSGAVVMMLVPRSLDAGLFGGLARVLAEHGEPRAGLVEVRGSYERAPGGGVRLRVERALRRDGTPVRVDALFDLGSLAGGAPS